MFIEFLQHLMFVYRNMHLITENMSTTKCLEIQDGVERKRRKIQEMFFMLSYKAHFEEVKRF